MDNNENTVTAVRDIVEKYLEPRMLDVHNTKGLIIAPGGMEIYSAKEFADKELTQPEILKGSTRLHDCDSFIRFIDRYKTESSALFYDNNQQKVTCIFDCATKENTSFEHHKAIYEFPFSDELKTWREKDSEVMSQVDFAFFIESNVLNLSDAPTPEKEGNALKEIRQRVGGHYASVSKMVELSKGISIRSDERATIKYDTNTGEATIDFSSEHTDAAGEKVRVPNMFLIVIPILKGGKSYQLPCRLRYRLNNGSVKWWYEVINLDKAIEMAVNEEINDIKEKTSLPIFHGELPTNR